MQSWQNPTPGSPGPDRHCLGETVATGNEPLGDELLSRHFDGIRRWITEVIAE
ncbi:hypothetical protein QFZ79_000513 [Arthrobacter sp. V4I6]|uniref:hypothetical protein n=1 Tax=unclassified Arthrobacter TaxID=235627 RepID=UPI0027823BA7|nr:MULTISPECIES: hypothetical protein [unclassified Arthrobacter]MDQ0822773.1 hypothetical protein [Arthrobacter sp. V1I7]MDQ0852402.1 hypothetical protein [Arthrobacter sp. V4I6]